MARETKPGTCRVISHDMTHVLPDEGLTLTGGVITEIPLAHKDRALQLQGVELVDGPATVTE